MDFEIKSGFYWDGDKQIPFNYYTGIPIRDKVNLVKFVSEISIVDDCFCSFVKDVMFDYALIDIFTDVSLDCVKDTDGNLDIDKVEEFISKTDIAQTVKENVTEGLVNELTESINDNIQYKTGINKNNISAAVVSLIKTVEKQMSSVDVTNMMEIAEKLSSMTDGLSADKIVEAYSKTDNFLGNQASVIEFKNKQIKELKDKLERK